MNSVKQHRVSACKVLLMLLGLCLVWLPMRGTALTAQARTQTILQELGQDLTFNVSEYPEKAEDYSLQLFQIAETADNALLLYVYQPSGRTKALTATSINISTAINDSLKYVNYALVLEDSAGTLYKYRVQGLTVKTDVLRYYDISSMYRPWDVDIDPPPTGDNMTDEVACAVSQQWTACTVNGAVTYSKLGTETIVVTDKHVGFLRYPDGFRLHYTACDAHYIAFSTDRKMESLMEADVHFVTRDRLRVFNWGEQIEYYDPVSRDVSLHYDDSVTSTANGIFAHKYTWDRIETAKTFVEKENLTDETKAAVMGKEWVLRFYETDYRETVGANGISTEASMEVTEVTILRLKFETAGQVYNLGVVDNKQSGDDTPDNGHEKEWYEWLWEFLVKCGRWIVDHWQLVLIVLVCVILLPIVISFFPFIWLVVKWIIKIILWPFKMIVRFFVWVLRG